MELPRATSFGAVADAYDALRPSWPAATAHWLVGEPGAGSRLRVLDLGAGTGKLSLTLAGLGHQVVAVDPDAAMLDRLREVGQATGRQVETRVGSAEAIPAEAAGFDAVTVAQAWHWFDPEPAAAGCARVLREGGVLAVAWHRRDESVPWVHELAEVAGRMEDVVQLPRARRPVLGVDFGPVDEAEFDYSMTLTAAQLRDLADTWSYVRLAEDRGRRLDAVLALGRREAARAARDAGRAGAEDAGDDAQLVLPHRTHCYRSVRSDRAGD